MKVKLLRCKNDHGEVVLVNPANVNTYGVEKVEGGYRIKIEWPGATMCFVASSGEVQLFGNEDQTKQWLETYFNS